MTVVPNFPWDWIRLEACVHDETIKETKVKSFMVSKLILDREGSDSYFAAHQRFTSAEGARCCHVHLGFIEEEVFRVLRVYLTSGTILFLYREALEYAADIYLMERLRLKLVR